MLIVFDLDGTLIDSVEDLAASASELAESLGGRPLQRSEVATMVGDGAAVLVRRALGAAGVAAPPDDALARFLTIYDRRLFDHTDVYPGMREALTIVARRARLAVLTNKPLRPTERLLHELGVAHFFERIIGGDGPHGRKPHAAGLQALMADSPGVATLLVGDSPIDWQTAQSAGCAFAWARYGFGAARFGATQPDTSLVLERPIDLVAVVDRFAAVWSGR